MPVSELFESIRRFRTSSGDSTPLPKPLIDLLTADIEFHWSQGTPKRIEDYIRDCPELIPVPTELILAEYRARQRYATTASADEYFERFPDHASTLASLLSGTQASPTPYRPIVTASSINAGQRIDDFDLLAIVGEGSFARVFLARQRSLQRLVALKVSADQGAEPQTLAQLDHPYIVRVYDQRSLPDQGLRLLYMPYLPGGTLRDVLQLVRKTPVVERTGKLLLQAVDEALARRGEVPPTDSINRLRIAGMTWPEAVCWLGARLADALDYAHKHGVLHRDIKPANVLLGADAAPRLADFNVSSTNVVGTDAAFGGSVAYMSPEQLEAFNPGHDRQPESLDGRSDIYSLAVSLWELLAGNRPFPNDPMEGEWSHILNVMTQTRQKPIPAESMAQLPPNLPPGMIDVLSTCLNPNRDDRYATAGELARQFDLCLKPLSRKLLVLEPGWRTWVARHPLIALYLVGLVPNIVAAWFNIEYNRTAIIEPYPAVSKVFQVLQVIVNSTFFPICMGLFGWFIWPVAKGLPRALRNEIPESELQFLRRRCASLGSISVLVCFWAWVAAGIIFPVVMHFSVQHLPITVHLHFLASQTLSGLMAVAYPQFGVTFLAIRCLYPRFVKNASITNDDVVKLRALDREQTMYLLKAASVPLLAVGLLSGIASENRIVLLILSAIGLVGFGLATYLTTAIRADRAALEAVAE